MHEIRFTSKDGSLQELLNKFYHEPPTEPEDAKTPTPEPTAPAFEAEPELTPKGQRDLQARASMQEMINRLNRWM